MDYYDIPIDVQKLIAEINKTDLNRVSRLVAPYWSSGDLKDAYDDLQDEMNDSEIEEFLDKYKTLIECLSQNLESILFSYVKGLK